MEVRVYEKETDRNILKLVSGSIKNLSSSWFLALQLSKRDISAQYRQSFLGLFWAFFTPLATAFVWIFLNSSGTVELSETGTPYPVYVFAGTLIWSIIVESINSPIKSTTAAKSILSKINFPKEALIVSGILKLLFFTFIKIVLLLLLVAFYDSDFSWTILLFPLAILGGVIVGNTIGLLLTPIGMLYRDIGKFITFSMQFIMYVTPVVYAVPPSGVMKTIMEINPLTPIVTVGRSLAIGATPLYLNYFITVIFLCIPLFFIALVFYKISIPIFVERLSA
jgi:lipopolysaccharide transport system permease protein